MIASYMLYIGMMIISWVLALIADKKNSKLCVWIIIGALSLMAGFRSYSVGLDTANYVTKFKIIASGYFQYAYGLEEPFKYLCYFFLKIIPDYTMLLLFFSFITNGCIIWRLWDFRNTASFWCMVACYYMSFYFMSLNVLRQFCAIAILMYSSRYLTKHKNSYYILGVLVASMFHQSALVGIILIFFEFLQWKKLKKNQKFFYLTVLAVSPVVILHVLKRFGRYTNYLSDVELNVGIMVPIKITFFLVTVALIFILNRKENHFVVWNQIGVSEKNDLFFSVCCYFLGLIFIMFSYVIPMMNRFGWYFTIYECVYMGMLTKAKNPLHKTIFIYGVFLIIGWGFVHSMIGNSQGTMPYLFVWQ